MDEYTDEFSNGITELDSRILKVATEAAQIGGDVLKTHLSRVKQYDVERKGEFDYATVVDHAAERAIIDHIHSHFPEHKILAEEGGSLPGDSVYRWIIDPLDGTTNYLHDVRIFAVSIAVTRRDQLLAGVVYDPMRSELFTAVRDHGAFLNGAPISVTDKRDLHECLFATGFPFRKKELMDDYLESLRRFFGKIRDVRRMGAAAIDLAYVAAGRFDGFWELALKKWDIAAGVLLIEEAGGTVTGFTDDEDFLETGNIVASNGRIHQAILDELAEVFSPAEVEYSA